MLRGLKYHTYQHLMNQGYNHYHKLVVEACVSLFGESKRKFFDELSYTEEFEKCINPEDVAQQQKESAV